MRPAAGARATADLRLAEQHGARRPKLSADAPSVKREHHASRFMSVVTGNPARSAIFVLGLATVIAAFVVWVVPTSNGTTTVSERSTTAVTGSAGTNTTAVNKTTTTRAPGAGRSDTVLVALLTFGVGLVLTASFWDRIQTLAVGGVSITLSDAAVAAPGIALVDAAAAHVDALDGTAAGTIAQEVDAVAKRGLGLVRIDLRGGDLWAPLNLSLFVLLLAHRSNAEVIVFTGYGEAGPDTYFGAVSIEALADKLAADDLDLAVAYRANETMPIDNQESAFALGQAFFEKLIQRDPSRAQSPERVDLKRLQTLAGRTLITASVQSEGERNLSKQQQRAILAFPLPFVPITDHRRLDQIVDRPRLADKIAHSAVGT